ncbi:hypothetical protein [Microbacterium testaceum]|uniref:hypothetical protein n=1 Tax=Microbacterium testaceum TaxID=2033 RepID=UPI002AC41FE9|nr:hypothetical protein [Microbacterium testaceum]MDZ5145943.1 hypothetical protein [Microbacterium testaceum]
MLAADTCRRPAFIMNAPIELQYPRSLALSNLTGARLDSMDPATLQRTTLSIDNHIKRAGAEPVGPLIQSLIVGVDSARDGVRIDLLRQSDRPCESSGNFTFQRSLTVDGCVLARFDGPASDIQFAYQKISVFGYENDIPLTGGFHTVFVERNSTRVVVDIFAITA